MILRLPKGYDTPLGDAGGGLSGGQKQRLGLARAMYDDPALIVLDEPNSNLDDVGEQALVTAVLELRKRGKTIVLITHRPSILGATTKLLVMKEGSVQAFGPTQQVMTAIQDANKKALEAAQQRTAEQGAGVPGVPGAPGAPKPRGQRYAVPERIAPDATATPPAATPPTTAPAAPAAPAATAAPAPGEIN